MRPDEVTAHLRELIVTGQIPGESYVRLDPVAEALGTSVTPIRESLLRLQAEGFVDLVPRRGFWVVPISDADVRDVYLAQAWVAGELAARATRALSARDLDDLERLQSDLESAHRAQELASVELCNHRFHRRVNHAADAPWLARQLRTAARFAPRRFFASIEGWPEASATEHRAIIAALRTGDAAAARAAMEQHIKHAGDLFAAHRTTAARAVASDEETP